MDAKQTIGYGIGALVIGVLLTIVFRDQVTKVLLGGAALLALAIGVLFVLMGFFQVREDRGNLMREKAEAEKAAAMKAVDA